MKISLIAAMDSNMAIGFENTLPWHIPTDMQHFRRTTTGRPIFMGRKTFESLGKALPKRTNFVLTSDANWQAPGATRVASIEDALSLANNDTHADDDFLWVIGGAQVYNNTLKIADQMVLTRLHMTLENADAYFPSFNEKDWMLTFSETVTDEKANVVLDIETWTRRK